MKPHWSRRDFLKTTAAFMVWGAGEGAIGAQASSFLFQ